ncbi:preprotein translocase subunit YajC [Microbulbifer sp. TYP-18]|uniref:preprotein translocase subunit YajC n=1 Tax=Microbulbifer sp. TYP-18 TaxID=3230024 RepID=UPI0034C6DA77
MSFFIPTAMAQQAAPAPQGNPMVTLLLFAGLFAFMWLFIIRPQRKRQKEHQELVSALKKGDEVVMSSGMLGRVEKVDDDYILLEVADKMSLRFQKVAVHAVLPKGTIKNV